MKITHFRLDVEKNTIWVYIFPNNHAFASFALQSCTVQHIHMYTVWTKSLYSCHVKCYTPLSCVARDFPRAFDSSRKKSSFMQFPAMKRLNNFFSIIILWRCWKCAVSAGWSPTTLCSHCQHLHVLPRHLIRVVTLLIY